MISNIIYANHDGVDLNADYYQPTTQGPHPVLVAIHGGGWQKGNSSFYKYLGPYLAKCGYAIFAINYRLVDGGKNRYPKSVNDVRAAIQFVKGNSSNLNIDIERIGLIGDSAGGHLATLVTLSGDKELYISTSEISIYSSINTWVKVCIGVYGVYDMAAQWSHDLIHRRANDNISENYLGFKPTENRKIYFEASPISHAEQTKHKTSFMLAWGTGDRVVDPETQSVVFMKALKQSGFSVRSIVIPCAEHYWISEPITDNGSYSAFFVSKLVNYLNRHL